MPEIAVKQIMEITLRVPLDRYVNPMGDTYRDAVSALNRFSNGIGTRLDDNGMIETAEVKEQK